MVVGETSLVVADIVDVNKKIDNRAFTFGWLLESLRTNDETYIKLHGNRAVKEIKYYDVSGGKGFISIVVRCTIHFVDSVDESDTYSTVLKIPGFESFDEVATNCDSEKFLDDDSQNSFTQIHEFECNFYKDFAKILDVPVPKVYKTVEWILGKKDGCIHMEDLTLRGKTITYFETINLTQVKCFIRHLAHWHKNILSIDPKIWHGKHLLKEMEKFKNILDTFDKMGRTFMEASTLKHLFDPFVAKYHTFSLSIEYITWAGKQSHIELGLDPVIVHGDMHSGNIMWAIDENGDVQNELAAFVDWQIMHEGSPMIDLARFLTMCADGVVRRQAEEFAIEYYFECLTKEFGNNKVPYTIEKLKKAYNYAFLSQAVFGLGIVPFFLGAMKDREPNQALKDAYRDVGALKALHMYEDVDRLLNGEMKDIFEKYGKEKSEA